MGIGFGIVGLGVIAHVHAEGIRDTERGEVTACFSRSREKADAFGKKFGCRAYSSYRDFLADPGLDVVCLCTPSGAHLEYALEAAEAGKHLMIEKPLEVTLERCDKIINACERKGVVCAGIFQSRFYDISSIVKGAVDSGRLGKLILADSYTKWFRSQEYYTDEGSWHGSWKLEGGGALMTQAIHSIDLLLWIMGQVDSIQAFIGTLGRTGIEVEDTAVATLQFKNGALGVVEGTTAIFPGFDRRIEIYGTRGSIIVVRHQIQAWEFAEERPEDGEIRKKFAYAADKESKAASDPTAVPSEGHRRQYQDMIEAFEGGRKPLVDGVEARRAVEIVLAIYESARERRIVRL